MVDFLPFKQSVDLLFERGVLPQHLSNSPDWPVIHKHLEFDFVLSNCLVHNAISQFPLRIVNSANALRSIEGPVELYFTVCQIKLTTIFYHRTTGNFQMT